MKINESFHDDLKILINHYGIKSKAAIIIFLIKQEVNYIKGV